ncbi:MAG: dihydroorotase [Acidimicrobiaceae bacterium]|nr:dihydroorotase [Acidimicrobiaceae bacterium]
MVADYRKYLIRGGTLVDSIGVRRADLLIEDGKIIASEPGIESQRQYQEIDARGLVVSSGFVDLHAHLREPGNEKSETIRSGSQAGILGGYTALVAMPNTTPTIDSPEVVQYVQRLADGAPLDIFFAGAITKGRMGESLTEMSKMADLGIKLFTDDGTGVQNAQVMRRALEFSKGIGVTIAQHCEDLELANAGSINEGAVSSILGVKGIPNAAEDVMVARDIELVRLTGARLHFLHISTARSAAMVKMSKSDGLPITAEVTPHHLVLSDTQLMGFDPVFKVNPPLRSNHDRLGLWDAFDGGVFDAVATDHAPHHKESKDTTLDHAAFGLIGLQTSFAAVLGELHRRLDKQNPEDIDGGGLSDEQLMHLVSLFTWKPARIARIEKMHGCQLVAGQPANITIFDPKARWRLVGTDVVSRSKNSPYFDTDLVGKVLYTFVNGELKLKEGELCL